jgi:hypothetical protein
MKKKWVSVSVVASVLAVCAGLSTPAFAGKKITESVVVDTAARHAYGALGSARNSTDQNQWIGCHIIATSTAANSFGGCSGQNSNNTPFSCSVSSSKIALMEAIRSVQGDSRIRVEWDASGNCTRIDVANDSRREPKK